VSDIAYGLVEFKHLHVAMRSIAFMLALGQKQLGGKTPFDEEREAAIEAIRKALELPLPEGGR
jgi:hypothetical protein